MRSLSPTTHDVLKPSGVRKGAWSKEEDDLLRKCIQKYGEGKWSSVPKRAGLKRCRKSCRLRWLNYLSPAIHRGKFSDDEVDLIIRLHKLLGNRWSLIAGRIPGRTANDIKNYWNSHLSKQLDAQHQKKMEATADVGVVKPQPQRVSKLWTWPKDQEDDQGIKPNGPKLPMIVEQQEQEWLNEFLSGEIPDHTENVLSSLDLHFSYEVEEVMDEEMFSEGAKRWEKLLQDTLF